jgi:hypothetical protein
MTHCGANNGRHCPYGAQVLPHIGHAQLLGVPSVQYVPIRAPVSSSISDYYATDFDGMTTDCWMFVGQVTAELHPHQLAGIFIASMFVDPLLITRRERNCMFVNLRSHADMNRVLNFKKRLLLDYGCVWVATGTDGELVLAEEIRRCQPRHLPAHCVTIEVCTSPPQYLLRGNNVICSVSVARHPSNALLPCFDRPYSSGAFATSLTTSSGGLSVSRSDHWVSRNGSRRDHSNFL